jgi:hypothetical protein
VRWNFGEECEYGPTMSKGDIFRRSHSGFGSWEEDHESIPFLRVHDWRSINIHAGLPRPMWPQAMRSPNPGYGRQHGGHWPHLGRLIPPHNTLHICPQPT